MSRYFVNILDVLFLKIKADLNRSGLTVLQFLRVADAAKKQLRKIKVFSSRIVIFEPVFSLNM